MKHITWNKDKNIWLKKCRKISFEDILYYITSGDIVDDIRHPNKDKYPNQRMFILNIKEYLYLVPYVESENELFLKTIIPSRKVTKDYLKGNKHG